MNDDRRCTAHSSRTGERCRKAAVLGGTVCENHGGSAPQVRAAAKRRLAEEAAIRRLDEFGIRPIGDPLDELAQLAAETIALKDLLAQRLATLVDIRYESVHYTEQLRAEFTVYERALDRAARTLADLARLGFTERQVQLAEAHGQLIAEAFRTFEAELFARLAAAGLAADVLARVRRDEVPAAIRAALSPLASDTRSDVETSTTTTAT